MIIYVSMLVVVFIGYCLQKTVVDVRRNDTRAEKFLVFLTFGYIIFWASIRNRFVDTAAYIRMFNGAQWGDLQFLDISFDSGWGFELLMILFKTFVSDNYQAWLMFLAIISGTCLAVIFWKYSSNYYYTLFLFLSMLGFTWLMNGIRQFLVVAIVFACTPLLEKKRWLPYFVVILLCATIHVTCIIMIPAYFVVHGKPWTKKTMLVIAGTVVIVFFASKFTNIMDAVLMDTKWSDVTTSPEFANDDGVNPLRVLVFSVPTFLAFIGRKKVSNKAGAIQIMTNMSILTTCIYAVGMVTKGLLFGRLPVYMELYSYMLLPCVIEKCFTKNSRILLYLISIPCYLFYFYLMTRGMYYSSELTGIIF